MKATSTLIGFIGLLSIITGLIFINTSNYGLPPLPTGYVLAMILLILGGGTLISMIVLITHAKISNTKKQFFYLNLVLACALIGIGIQLILHHPLETPACPCEANHWGPSCEMCTCVMGTCNDGGEGDGSCLCDMGWGGENCDVCAPTYQDDPRPDGSKCSECKRGFWKPLEGCKECYPGYMDSSTGACNQCAPTWETESDALGLLCRRCLPEHYGGYCKFTNSTLCKAEGDTLAFAKDNHWQRANVYTGNTCTPSGRSCKNPYDCDDGSGGSFNCKGQCVKGDETSGDLCEDDLECADGWTCEYRVCCLEKKVADGSCQCGRSGYAFNGKGVCQKCPGFDGVYSASICSGHGTCAVAYAGDPADAEIVGVNCVCAPEGDEPLPTWSGPECGCLKETETGPCVECWDGFFGANCDACPGGAGIAQCNKHGICNDGLTGDGTCSCDIDVKYQGLGAWKGDSCDACMNDDFFGQKCQICPSFMVVACNANTNPFLPNQCTSSCAAKTCNVDTGFCE